MQLPYFNITQSILAGPKQAEYTLVLNIKILPPHSALLSPFYGIYLLDTSGSMEGEKIDAAIESFIEQVNSLPDGTIFTLIGFGPVDVIFDHIEITNQTKSEIVERLHEIEAEDDTPLKEAIDLAMEMLLEYHGPLKTKVITLITDGYGDIEAKDAVEYAKQAVEHHTFFNCVGALNDHDVDLLYTLANRSLGKYIFASTVEELNRMMTLATQKSAHILFDFPGLTLMAPYSSIKTTDIIQIKPTVCNLLFENAQTKSIIYFRSLEAGESYDILVRIDMLFDLQRLSPLPADTPTAILECHFDFGKPGLQKVEFINLTFASDVQTFHFNRQLLNQFNSAKSMIEEIQVSTKKQNPELTQKLQGDETRKVDT